MNKREFTVETPLGRLRVWAKYDDDREDDFPGVYIDLCRDGKDDDSQFACVEYNPIEERIQCNVYSDPESEYPTHIIGLGETENAADE